MQISVNKIDASRIRIRTIHEIAPGKVSEETKRRGFELEAYFFVPARLAHGSGDELDGAALSQPVIFPNIQRKNHYEIFAINLAAILDLGNELSPLSRLEHMAHEVVLPAERVLYELQMLVCVTKRACTNARRAQIQRIQVRQGRNSQNEQTEEIREELRNELENEFSNISHAYLQIQTRLEHLGERYLHEVLRNIDEAYRWTLEDLNHQILDWMLRVLRLSEHYQFSKKFREFLQAELELQWLYQKQNGFATLSDDEYNNESYLFHQRELKAWRYSVLAMSSTEARSPNVMNHIWLSVASAVAMTFALIVTLLTMYYYGQWSMPFLVFAVLGYMFKDRIKEVLRNLFSVKFGNYNLLHLYDPRSKEQCGSIRESLDVCESLPTEIATLRKLYKNPLSSMFNREVVIAYRERLNLNSQKLLKTHKRLQSGCQLLEFNLLPYLQNIKESEVKQFFRPIQQAKQWEKLHIKRSYHLTLIIKARTFDGQEISERYRIVLRDKKISWVKQVV